MSRVVDPWQRVYQCCQMLKITSDVEDICVLTGLRDLWITSGNARTIMTDTEYRSHLGCVDRVHADMVAHVPKPH